MTDKTTRFVRRRICETCGSDSWRLQEWTRPSGPDNQYRCTGCRRVVANYDPATHEYVDEDDDLEGSGE